MKNVFVTARIYPFGLTLSEIFVLFYPSLKHLLLKPNLFYAFTASVAWKMVYIIHGFAIDHLCWRMVL